MAESFTIDQIEAVRAIARLGSFSAAADELYLTQPAISQRIRNLEHALGVTEDAVIPHALNQLIGSFSRLATAPASCGDS